VEREEGRHGVGGEKEREASHVVRWGGERHTVPVRSRRERLRGWVRWVGEGWVCEN
jgi:hypothetical protein